MKPCFVIDAVFLFVLLMLFGAGRSGSARLFPGFSLVPTLISLNVPLRDTAQAFDAFILLFAEMPPKCLTPGFASQICAAHVIDDKLAVVVSRSIKVV